MQAPHPRMMFEHRPFRRSLGSNAINGGKIAVAVLRHFLHWSVFLCETRWRLHLHAQPPEGRVTISLPMWNPYRRSQADVERLLPAVMGHFLIGPCCSNIRSGGFASAGLH